ncbi:DNA primase [Loktanella sp. IMCC34160]|uniref:DNA primase n=1 Tax=Loktanella sp. IMCC34160 TaxID=2510646 RepID=UPI00101B66CF|nr:DNA primase [Loktanella sp. IMCC34160]RYG93173.1 DNA primase [Loktanella sp. IMCC34160]
MSLPPGFLDELRGRLSLGQVVGRKVMWDTRKSNQAKGDLWAPCPFHQEKTASFHVDDRKGYYYCFGCHAKGDAISFVRETENVSFMEAIEILAREAGLPMPERDPQAQEKADRRTQLAEVMEEAVKFYRLQLKTGAGAEARDYLARRGLSEAAQDRWGIGFAPPGWEALREHLTAKGIEAELILAAGLARPSDKGRAPYDTFRNRIMFPIRDLRGRCIAFGGRAMDPNDNAKYLNSPETELFDKGRSLYNHAPAREAAGKGHPLIVAEGYMDVIALSEAGFPAVVAPLGTAITEDQLRLMWRMAPEPVIALDGDTAGLRAADRLIGLALKELSGHNSLFFLEIPGGQDPDDFLRADSETGRKERRQAFQELLDGAMPLVRKLWNSEFGKRSTETPEQKADLDKRLRGLVAQIPDPDVRKYYGEALKQYRFEAFRPQNWAPEFKRKPQRAATTAEAKSSLLASGVSEAQLFLARDRIVAGICLANPLATREFRDGLERFDVVDANARTIIDAVLGFEADDEGEAFINAIRAAVGNATVERILFDPLVKIQPVVRENYPLDIVKHEFAYHIAIVTSRRAQLVEKAEAEEDIDHLANETLTFRLRQAGLLVDRAMKGGGEDRAEFETGPNGARMKKEERTAFDRLLSQIDYSKGSGKRRPH